MLMRTSTRRSVPVLACLVSALAIVVSARAEDGRWLDAYREPAARIIGVALSDTFAWRRLAELTDTFGHRLSGTPQLEAAIRWAAEEMKKDGLDNVHTEPVMVPRWVRGQESAEILQPARHPMVMLGLGGSVATPPEGIEAEALVVGSFDDLDARAQDARGRIVVYNVPFTTYGETVQYRSGGASRAARHGAVAALVRSVGPESLRTPHTGGMRYSEDAPRIPAAAITIEDAERLRRMQDRGARIVIRLKMEAQMLPDAESANVVAEIRGREKPDEVAVVGGHIDSWDVGAGASDDGGGCVVTWEALRIIRKLNLRPRRTLRLVLWTNEENGTRGGVGYRDRHKDELANHVMMLESDSGVFRARGFGFTGNDRARATVTQIASLLTGLGMDHIGPAGGGADIGPSVQAGKIPAMALQADASRYFVIHHTPADTVDKIDPTDMARSAAGVAVMAYVVADMPGRLGH
jgi:carboxypeptidase Q